MRGVTTGLAGRADVTVAASVPASVPAYAVAGLSKTYRSRRDGGAVLANDDVSLSVGQGEIFGLLGPNGAGKSTLVRHLVGLLRPDRGRVLLLGDEVTGRPQRAARAVAYLAQHEPALDEIPVSLAVETTGRLRGLSRPAARAARDALLTELGLEAVAGRPLGQVSGGQRRLAAVATALVADRPVLVLDEPTTGLDPTARRAVWSALDRRRQLAGTTVVLVTHNVLEAENVLDRVAVLDVGRVIACDTPGRLKARYGGDVRLDLVWREPPPTADATVNLLRARAQVVGRRWSVSLPVGEARAALGRITDGPAFAALDDFTLATPTLEEVYLALGGTADDLERQ